MKNKILQPVLLVAFCTLVALLVFNLTADGGKATEA